MTKRLLCIVLFLAGIVQAEDIRLATYNVERFQSHFESIRLRMDKNLEKTPEMKDLIAEVKKLNDEDNWEVATVILDPKVNPDILVIQEGCDQKNLDHFNKHWLKEAYSTVIQFTTNTDRNQNLCMLLKAGFKIIERKDQYYLEKDTATNPRSDKLFARGPVFCLIETPSGYRFWVGTTHVKSKSGNDAEVTAWRNREAVRTHQIMKELQKQGPDDVILLGDCNDELGLDKDFEKDSGGDTIANLIGPSQDGFILADKPLIDAGKISFGGYWQERYRSFIDHIICTPGMKGQIKSVDTFTEGLAPVASDHYPVIITIKADETKK